MLIIIFYFGITSKILFPTSKHRKEWNASIQYTLSMIGHQLPTHNKTHSHFLNSFTNSQYVVLSYFKVAKQIHNDLQSIVILCLQPGEGEGREGARDQGRYFDMKVQSAISLFNWNARSL